ncbi:hypothetical protein KC19_8G146900 [Ceratodon purpureus]|uniref:SMP domain-containing protein n=1 Tax=Ceratodon purpureus TaxID=3225 RepID=A0A8T0GZ00_CERPU|nr:hypothetical protein KC19_8G146900 [Ceratodon purpureus]
MEAEQMSKMSEDVSLLKSPVTYGNILGAKEKLGSDVVMPEDAALMQSAEARTFGQTQDGAGSVMQAAAEENVKAGFVKKGDHSEVAEEGVIAQEILVPGAEIDLEYVAGQPVMAHVTPTPTDSFFIAPDAITIGDALEAAAVGAGDRPVEKSDARAIQSAVQRATGATPTAGGLVAAAMSAADLNLRVPTADKTTLEDILMDASIDLEVDKVVTQEDAAKVLDAELRGSPTGEPHPGGVAAAVQAAADINEQAGFIPQSTIDHARAFPLEDTPVSNMPNPSSEDQTESMPKPASGEAKPHAKED